MKKCIICNTDVHTFRSDAQNIEYHRCPNCDLISKDESSYISVEAETKLYLLHHNSIESKDYVAYLKNFVNKAILPFNKGYHLLEFGSGPTPVLTSILKDEYGFSVEKYDKIFSKKKDYLDYQYNVITCTEVIEHVSELMPLFEEWNKVLFNDGIISIMTLFHPQENDVFLKWWYIRDQTHINFFSRRTFEVLAKIFHFDILFCDNHRMIVMRKKESTS
ncbi:MAG: methyltransferase domain-containing protein [Candidatus Izemoplasmatales bacterium]|nr:methyltransferase domain-containing protein [Candidatus Izemoplasmatales bacterium]